MKKCPVSRSVSFSVFVTTSITEDSLPCGHELVIVDLIAASCPAAQNVGTQPFKQRLTLHCYRKCYKSHHSGLIFSSHTHPVGEFGAAVVTLWQVENGVVVGMSAVQKRANVLHVVLVADLHGLCRVRHHCKDGNDNQLYAYQDKKFWKKRNIALQVHKFIKTQSNTPGLSLSSLSFLPTAAVTLQHIHFNL